FVLIKKDEDTHDEHQVFRLLPEYYVGVTAHTPMGAFGINAGGGIFADMHRSEKEDMRWSTGHVSMLELSYTAFLSRYIFVRLETGVVNQHSYINKPDGYHVNDIYSTTS